MPKYRAYGHVHGSKFIGEFEADNPEEAKRLAEESDECWVNVCHQCAREVDDPVIDEIDVELAE